MRRDEGKVKCAVAKRTGYKLMSAVLTDLRGIFELDCGSELPDKITCTKCVSSALCKRGINCYGVND